MINFASYCPDGQQRSCCAYPSTPHWRSLCGDNTLYINHVPRSGSNYRASTGGRFGTAPRYGMEGASRPHKGTTLRSLRFSRSFVPLWGWGYAKPLRGFCYTDFCWRDGGILTPVDFLRAFDRLYSDSGLLTHFLLPSAFRSPTSTFSRRGSLRPLAVVLY